MQPLHVFRSLRSMRKIGLIVAASAATVIALGLAGPSLAGLGALPTSADEGIGLPFPAGTQVKVSQGIFGAYSHTGQMAHAVDFIVEGQATDGFPVVAVKRGTIAHVQSRYPDNHCGGSGLANQANYVVLNLEDGTAFLYLHLSRVDVQVGQHVQQGQRLGLAGKTGWTQCGPHLHLQRQKAGPSWFATSIPMRFDEAPGRELHTGDVLVSRNGQSAPPPPPSVNPPAPPASGGYHVTAPAGLHERSGPGTNFPVVGFLPDNTAVGIVCQERGSTAVGGSNVWDKLSDGHYVTDYWVSTPNFNQFSPGLAQCTSSGGIGPRRS